MAELSSSSSSIDSASKRKRSSSSSSQENHRSKERRSSKKRTSSTSSQGRGSESEADSVASTSSSVASSSSSRKNKSTQRHANSKSTSTSSSSSSKTNRPPYLSQLPLSSAFELQYPLLNLSIAPIHASRPMVALTELMDSLVMRFVPPLNGVLISHGQAFFMVDHPPTPPPDKDPSSHKEEQASMQMEHLYKDVGPSALIGADAAFATSKVAVECCVWRPKIGMKIEGVITLSTPSHVSLLIHATFNASISSDHMTDYEFIESSSPPSNHDELQEPQAAAEDFSEESGYWRHKVTRQRLGASSGGRVQFAIISLTISPPSLSLSGSLLERPFDVPPLRIFGATSKTARLGGAWTAAATGDAGVGGKGRGMGSEATEAIKKATRRVRWEEDDDESDDTDDGEEVQGRNDGRGVGKQIVKTAGKHVKF